MKLLLMAYECSPYRGSECAVGWGRLLGAAKIAETHVITSGDNFSALEQAQATGLLPANVFLYTPASDVKLNALAKKPGLFAYNYRAYHHWQKLAFTLAQQLHRHEFFDLVHQVNVCTFREPGYTWRLGIPFVWGPFGGTQNFPTRFLPMLPFREAAKEGLRSLGNWVALRKSRVHDAARHAHVIYAANATNQKDLSNAFSRRVELLLETGLHEVHEPDRSRFEARLTALKSGKKPTPLRLLWTGQLQTRKGLPILLRALAQLRPEIDWQLDVIGDGPCKASWMQLTQELDLMDKVQFLGRLPSAEALRHMQKAELFCFTSLRDTSGNVVLEALAAGTPVLCFDHQGGADMVNEVSGIKLPVRSPRQAYRDWSEAIAVLSEDPRKLYALSRGASVRARHFLWARNHEQLEQTYRQLTDKAGNDSELNMSSSDGIFDIPFGAIRGDLV